MTSRTANRKATATAAGTSTSRTTVPSSSSSRQRWQPEEDTLVQEYVRRHGPREWHLLRSRMGVSASRFLRDPKSCAERWKNYLKPGLKKGPLSPDEQALALALQARHGNRWKLIAKSLPGRTPKRLGKWWEVFSDRQRKQQQQQQEEEEEKSGGGDPQQPQQEGQKGRYDHILDTYVEKHVLPAATSAGRESNNIVVLEDGLSLMSGTTSTPGGASESGAPGTPGPVLSLGTLGSSGGAVPSTSTTVYGQHVRHSANYMNNYYGTNMQTVAAHTQVLPAWLSTAAGAPVIPMASTITAATPSSSQSVGLSLTSAPSGGNNNNISVGPHSRSPPQHEVPAAAATTHQILPPQLAALGSLWRDLEDSRQGWLQHRKEAAWRLGRLEQQMEAERARRAKDKVEECEARVRALREEQAAAVERIEMEYRDQLAAIQRDAESREGRLLEGWSARHARLARVVERVGSSGAASQAGPAGAGGGMRVKPFTSQYYNGSNNH